MGAGMSSKFELNVPDNGPCLHPSHSRPFEAHSSFHFALMYACTFGLESIRVVYGKMTVWI